jgi:hypothetical protein
MSIQLPLHTHVELVTCGFSRRFKRGQKSNHNQKLRDAKSLTLDYYEDMLNTKLQGNEGVLFLLY